MSKWILNWISFWTKFDWIINIYRTPLPLTQLGKRSTAPFKNAAMQNGITNGALTMNLLYNVKKAFHWASFMMEIQMSQLMVQHVSLGMQRNHTSTTLQHWESTTNAGIRMGIDLEFGVSPATHKSAGITALFLDAVQCRRWEQWRSWISQKVAVP